VPATHSSDIDNGSREYARQLMNSAVNLMNLLYKKDCETTIGFPAPV